MYPRGDSIENSDELRNITCHEYLSIIRQSVNEYIQSNPTSIPSDIQRLLGFLNSSGKAFDKKYPYGNDYTNFMEMLDGNIFAWRAQYQNIPLVCNLLKKIVFHVYDNPNNGLVRATETIESILSSEQKEPLSKLIEDRMAKSTSKKLSETFSWQPKNKSTPHKMESSRQRLKVSRVGRLRLQHKTNTPGIRSYAYKEDLSFPKEYRFGTQAQFTTTVLEGRDASVAPMFEYFLEVQKEKRHKAIQESKTSEIVSPITHIYFNNLKSAVSPSQASERGVEAILTNTLNELEKKHDNIAVITFPADNDWISHHALGSGSMLKINDELWAIRQIAIRESSIDNRDFYISPKIKTLLYENPKAEEKKIDDLLKKSIKKLGLEGRTEITPDEKQALYFHFIKFELTDFIINKLKPDSFNMSCKDAIDRGGISSAYYNLMKSLELGNPVDKNEFNCALYGAPLLVKGRGMNDHIKLIWNAVNTYLNNSNNLSSAPDWLKEWCTHNNPNPSPHSAEMVNQLELDDYIKHHCKDVIKIAAAKKLKALLDDREHSTLFFSRSEWKAFQDGRLREIFANQIKQLSDEQQTKIVVLNEMHEKISNLKPFLPGVSTSPDFELGKKLWEIANHAPNTPVLTLTEDELARIKKTPSISKIAEMAELLMGKSLQTTKPKPLGGIYHVFGGDNH